MERDSPRREQVRPGLRAGERVNCSLVWGAAGDGPQRGRFPPVRPTERLPEKPGNCRQKVKG